MSPFFYKRSTLIVKIQRKMRCFSIFCIEIKFDTKGQKKKKQPLDCSFLQKSGGKAHGFNRGMKAKKLFAIIGQ